MKHVGFPQAGLLAERDTHRNATGQTNCLNVVDGDLGVLLQALQKNLIKIGLLGIQEEEFFPSDLRKLDFSSQTWLWSWASRGSPFIRAVVLRKGGSQEAMPKAKTISQHWNRLEASSWHVWFFSFSLGPDEYLVEGTNHPRSHSLWIMIQGPDVKTFPVHPPQYALNFNFFETPTRRDWRWRSSVKIFPGSSFANLDLIGCFKSLRIWVPMLVAAPIKNCQNIPQYTRIYYIEYRGTLKSLVFYYTYFPLGENIHL